MLAADLMKRPSSASVNPRCPLSLPLDPCPVAWERESARETAHGAAGPDNRGPRRLRPKRQSRPRPKFAGILSGGAG